MTNPFEELTAYLARIEAQNNRIEKLLTERQPEREPQTRRPLNLKEAAVLIGFKEKSVYQLVHYRKIPFHKVGKSLRFNEDELLQWINAGRVETVEEIQESARKSREKK